MPLFGRLPDKAIKGREFYAASIKRRARENAKLIQSTLHFVYAFCSVIVYAGYLLDLAGSPVIKAFKRRILGLLANAGQRTAPCSFGGRVAFFYSLL